jgi:hypothetical protein
MTDFKAFLSKLHQNLNTLREREAKYNNNAPLELLNQIADHEQAIALTEQAITGNLSEADWEENLRPLLVSVAPFRAAQSIVVILGQYAADQGAKLSQEVGSKAAATAGELLTTTLAHLRRQPTGALIAAEFEQDPVTYQKPLEKSLAEAIVSAPELAGQLKALLTQYGQASRQRAASSGPRYQATLSGSGAIAQGPGAQAVGAGGVMMGGNVGGNVITGSQNRIINTGGGMYNEGTINTGGGDVVGRDQHSGLSGADLAQMFREIYSRIETRPLDPNVDKAEVKETVEKIEQEVTKGEAANESKVGRWLKTLQEMAPDIGEVTIACLTNPAAGVALVIKKIAEKAKAESQ